MPQRSSTVKWTGKDFGRFQDEHDLEPSQASASPFRLTMEVRARVGELDVCPIELETMVDPVRVIHQDEAMRGPGAVAHVLSREAAERWLAQDVQHRCPLCRSPVLRLESDVAAQQGLQNVIATLAAENFQGGDNLAHKAVKLLDAKLFGAIGRFLPTRMTHKMLLQSNDEGVTPLALLEEMHPPPARQAFLEGLTQRGEESGVPKLAYSPLSCSHGGSEVWCQESPVFAGSRVHGPDGSVYTAFYAAALPPDAAEELSPRGRRGGAATEEAPEEAPEAEAEAAGPGAPAREAAEAAAAGRSPPRVAGEAPEAEAEAEDRVEEEARVERQNWASPQRRAARPSAQQRFSFSLTAGSRSPFSPLGPPQVLHRWGNAVLLRSWVEAHANRTELCVCPVMYSRVPRIDRGFDEEVFEPVVRVQRGLGQPKVFHGRVAARRGIWIGGTAHFDDLTIPGEAGACALIIFDPGSSQWKLFPGVASKLSLVASRSTKASAREQEQGESADTPEKAALSHGSPNAAAQPASTSRGDATENATTSEVGEAGAVLPKLVETRIRLSSASQVDLVLEPAFVARRWSEAAPGAAMPGVAATPAEARRMRERVVLLLLRTTVRLETQAQLGAVLTDFSIGRGEACNLRFSEVLSVSRSHCVLALQEVPGGSPRLVVYDDGSLSGTQLSDTAVGVGPQCAEPIREGDVLRLGSEVTIHLQAVSPVLSLDDNRGLAEFFEGVGEWNTAHTLRQEPRLTEAIVSFSLTAGPSHSQWLSGGGGRDSFGDLGFADGFRMQGHYDFDT